MSTVGKVVALYISTIDKKRQQKEQLSLDKDGIIGDKFHAKDLERSILISSIESYQLANENGISVEYGKLGENVLLDINPYGLKSGDKVVVGEVILEITQNCTICNSLANVHEKLPKILQKDRGIFAKSIQNGTIKKGDKVELQTN